MIERMIKSQIEKNLIAGKVVGLFGARRTGKTVLMKEIFNNLNTQQILMVQGDNMEVSQILSSKKLSELKQFIKGYSYLFIDEAQKISDIGLNLKLLVDNEPGLKIFITGSSALELRNKIGEPLTGRSIMLSLFPFSQPELNEDYLKSKQSLERKLIFGLYPDVFLATNEQDKKEILINIRDGYLLKDVLELDNTKDTQFIFNLLRLIAFQIGQDISYQELAVTLGVARKTVQRYLEILEKSYIIFSMQGFSRNLRKEYSKSPRYYFWDNGMRNAVISNFNKLDFRDDVGKLWENYCISERIKLNHYNRTFRNFYFWRTYDQQEIDLIEEGDGKINTFEFKWKPKNSKLPVAFKKTYEVALFSEINSDNYLEFINRI
jgi:uncharacterized protein